MKLLSEVRGAVDFVIPRPFSLNIQHRIPGAGPGPTSTTGWVTEHTHGG